MSNAPVEISGSPHLPSAPRHLQDAPPATSQPSFLESFLNSFFQEKNIKWMLVVGAAIVFGSSLMLVTRAWPHWPNSIKFLTLLGYTGLIFGAAEVSRKRLALTSTYKVLHSLTLLLIPVCFLSLQWLTSGTAAQTWKVVEFLGLMLPATAFLWFASSRILDHLLRGRQTTFLLSYCLLSIAGAIPAIVSADGLPITNAYRFAAFAFMAICWSVFTAGVVKVNRHTFWLAEEHRLPRVFGFLPIAILGLQFVVLTASKAITVIPTQWVGFGCIMVATTVLLTARTVADVFRQRTGNLVRPLPWHIVVPLFSGLTLTALGMALSFRGFHYVGTTTYAVIPTAIVASLLMWMAARDTRHSGFVWAGMICAAIAYQCCPTLFADVVQSLKASTAQAINQKRVPFSMYGITYLPLLATFAVVSRWFSNRDLAEFSKPLKHFVTTVGLILFCMAITNWTSLLFVSLANIVAFLGFAIAFQDRRYVIAALIGLITATAAAIPAYISIQGTAVPQAVTMLQWIPTLLAGLAALLTATRLPDRILNTIPISDGSFLRRRDPATGIVTQHSALLQNADGSERNMAQLFGCVLAAVCAAHWIGQSIFVLIGSRLAGPDFHIALTNASMLQYGFLMAAFVLYTLRHPKYLSGFCFWGMVGFAALRWAVEQRVGLIDFLNTASLVTAGSSLLGYLLLKSTGQISTAISLSDLRRSLGTAGDQSNTDVPATNSSSGWTRQIQAFVVPLCDLSLVILSCLAAWFHLPLLLQAHLPILQPSMVLNSLLGIPTAVTVVWLIVATFLLRSRIAGIAATIALPLWITATAATFGVPLTFAWCAVVWVAVEALIYLGCSHWKKITEQSPLPTTLSKVSEGFLQAVLILSCLSFDWPLRIAALIAIGCFVLIDGKRLNESRAGYLAIIGNIHLILLAAWFGGCRGAIVTVANHSYQTVIPFVFLVSAISVAIFDHRHPKLEAILCRTWTALLRTGMLLLAILSLTGAAYPAHLIAMMATGCVTMLIAEIVLAVRQQEEQNVWNACGIAAFTALFLFCHGVIPFGMGISQFVLLGLAIAGLCFAELATRKKNLAITRRPMYMIGQTLPMLVALMAVVREFSGFWISISALNVLALMIAAGIYFQQAMVTRQRRFAFLAAAIMNVGLMLLWRSLQWNALEFYLVPVGLSVLGFVELLRKELPKASHDPLRYLGALTILVSPLFEVISGDWMHMLALMVLSVVVILAAIGLRIRVLVYAGSAFLLADLVAMIFHTTMLNPILPWVVGLGLGVAVIALAAFCENHREKLLSQVRYVSAELATWH